MAEQPEWDEINGPTSAEDMVSEMKPNQKMMDSPFWKVMSVAGMLLLGGAVTTATSALNKLDKLNDAQIETKTMMSVLISQRATDQEDIKTIKADIQELQLNQVQLKTMVEQTHNVTIGLNKQKGHN